MSSKQHLPKLQSFVVFTLMLTTPACGLKFGEQNQPSEPVEIATEQSGCFAGSAELLEDVFTGRGDAQVDIARIRALDDCVKSAIDTFLKRTRGERVGEYSPDELQQFVETYFLKNVRLTARFKSELMALKRALVGGTLERVTVREILTIQELISSSNAHLIKLRPYLPFNIEALRRMPPKVLAEFETAALAAAADLGGRIDTHGTSTTLGRFLELAESWFEATSPAGERPTWLTNLKSELPTLQHLKFTLQASPGGMLRRGDWRDLLGASIKVAFYGVKWDRAMQAADSATYGMTRGSTREAWVELAKEILTFGQTRLRRHAGGVLSFSALDRWVDLVDRDLFQIGGHRFGPAVAKRALRPLVLRVLGGADLGLTGRKATGISTALLTRVSASLDRWNSGQRMVEEIINGKRAIGSDPDGITNLGLPPAAWDDKQPKTRIDFASLSELNTIGEFGRLLMAGYTESVTRAQSKAGVSVEEFDRFYNDFKEFGVAIKYLDPENPFAAQSRFREANLFLPISNGDGLLDLKEGVQLLSFMVAAKGLSTEFHSTLERPCGKEKRDLFGKTILDTACVRTELKSRFGTYFERIPGLVTEYLKKDAKRREEFFPVFEDAVRVTGYCGLPYDSRDTDTLGLMLQYVESLLKRWDRNGDSLIQRAEAKRAFPLFKETLKQIPEVAANDFFSTDQWLEGLFLYLLEFGQPPDTSLGGKAKFLYWYSFSNSPINADRTRILNIFAELQKAFLPAPEPGKPVKPRCDIMKVLFGEQLVR